MPKTRRKTTQKSKTEEESAKNQDIETHTEAADVDLEQVKTAEESEGKEVIPSAGPRKPLGTKEPIPFKWKLVGKASDYVLTLFKSPEKADVEAQMVRALRDGYYTNLEIVDIDTQFKQPRIEELRNLHKDTNEKTGRKKNTSGKKTTVHSKDQRGKKAASSSAGGSKTGKPKSPKKKSPLTKATKTGKSKKTDWATSSKTSRKKTESSAKAVKKTKTKSAKKTTKKTKRRATR